MAVSRYAKKICRIRTNRRRRGDDQNQANQTNEDEVSKVAEEIRTYLTKLYGRFDDGEFQFPGSISFYFNLQRSEDECPFLSSYFSVRSEFGNVCSGEIEIHANKVEEILRVLVQLKVSSFKLINPIPDEYVNPVQEFFSSNLSLRKLCILEHFMIQDQQLVHSILKSLKSLSTLDLIRRGVGIDAILDRSLNHYIRFIPECNSIEKLKVANFSSQETIDCIAGLLLEQTDLKSLDMSNEGEPRVKIDTVKIAQALISNDTLQELDLGGRALATDDCISEFATVLKSNACLKRLDLQADRDGNDFISPDAWIPLGNALANNSALKYLDISNCQVSVSSWTALAEGLKRNNSLLTLKASNINMSGSSDNGGETDYLLPMFEMLRENKTLQTLQLTRYNLSNSAKSLEALASALTENTTLKWLNLAGSSMSDEGARILSRGLPKMKGLEHLDLNHHNFSQEGARALAAGIRNNYRMLSIGVGQAYRHGRSLGCMPPLSADGYEKEYHEIQYYVRLNRKARRCLCHAPLQPSLWPLVLARALQQEKQGALANKDVRREDAFAGSHDTSIDAVYYLLRNVMTLPVGPEL